MRLCWEMGKLISSVLEGLSTRPHLSFRLKGLWLVYCPVPELPYTEDADGTRAIFAYYSTLPRGLLIDIDL